MTHDVFISYSNKDKIIADVVCSKLENSKVKCWIAPRDIDTGRTYAGAITSAIQSSTAFLLILSSNSNSSSQVLRELELATSISKIILPLKIDEFELNPDLKFYLAGVHRLEVVDGDIEKSIEILLEQINKIVPINIDSISEIIVDTSHKNELSIEIKKVKPGDIIKFGKYYQGNNLNNCKEDLEWRVLAVDNGKLLLLSDKILDCKQYNDELVDITWESCTLRFWLNNDFYNVAFTSEEQGKIALTSLTNEDNPRYGTKGGNDTNDKIFLLSFNEVLNTALGFSSRSTENDIARWARGTDFSKSKGLYVSKNSSHSGNSYWWLRTPGDIQINTCYVNPDGNVYYSIYYNVSSTNVGVRPALWVNI